MFNSAEQNRTVQFWVVSPIVLGIELTNQDRANAVCAGDVFANIIFNEFCCADTSSAHRGRMSSCLGAKSNCQFSNCDSQARRAKTVALRLKLVNSMCFNPDSKEQVINFHKSEYGSQEHVR